MRVFDTSNLAYGVQETVSVAVFQKFKAAGFDMLWLGLHGGGDPNYRARETLSNAKAAGLMTAGYAVIVPGRAADIIRSARGYADTAWPYLEFMVVDVEWEQQTLSIGDAQEAAATIEQLGQVAWLYTYREYWQGRMGNPVDCANIPLIDADYPGKGKAGKPTLDMAFPYGGWTRRAGHQYQDTHDEFGIDVDCDLIDDTMLRHVGTEDDNMTDQQKQALDLMVGIGWNGREREELGNLITREAEYRKVQVPQLTARVDQLTKRLTDVKGLMQSIKQTAVEVETTLESGTG